jgi:uncharacterized sulfatase
VCGIHLGFFAVLLTTVCATAAPPNVLCIVVDDLNADLHAFGHPIAQTPNIDRLVSRGMRFDRAYCQFTLCSPSRESFLSGRRPESTGVISQANKVRDLSPEVTYLPEQFQKSGYTTRAVGKVFHGNKTVMWDASEDAKPRSAQEKLAYEVRAKAEERAAHGVQWMSIDDPEEQLGDGIVARTAVEYLRQAAQEKKPFFIAAGFRKPHLPWTAPRSFFRQYPKSSIARLQEPTMKDVPTIALMTDITPRSPRWIEEFESVHGSPFSREEAIAAYYACISFIDSQVGLISEALDNLRLRDNTIVVFFSDHGFHLGDHGGLWAKLSLFERSARVPLAMVVPGLPPGSTTRIVELVDLYPTLVELCGLPTPLRLDGRSVVPLLKDPKAEWNKAAYTNTVHEGVLGRSVRTDQWRYTEWDNGDRIVARELYAHPADGGEYRNLAGDAGHAHHVAALQRLMRQFPQYTGAIPSTSQSRSYD